MPSDSLPSTSQVRAGSIGMVANGAQIAGIKQFEVTNSNYFTCDTWRATVALDGTPSGYGAPFWALQDNIEVSLLASFTGPGALTTVIGGVVDKVEISLDRQELILSGRDFSAPLIDTLTNTKFVNQTSSEIATKFAQDHGLVPQVTGTSTQVGRYLSSQYDYASQDLSQFRLLSYLAQQEGFDLYMNGKTMVFGPAVRDTAPLRVVYTYAAPSAPPISANAETLELLQDKTLATFVTVEVRSWDYTTKKAIISTWQSQKTQNQPKGGTTARNASLSFTKASTSGSANGRGPLYIVRRSGLTPQQADDLAKKTLANITLNERAVRWTGPAILHMNARRGFSLTGTRTAFDQTYEIAEVTRAFGWDSTSMHIHAKASSPQELVSL